MEIDTSFAGILDRYMTREECSAGRLAKLTEIPKTTIENWLAGTAKRPRDWRLVLKLAQALHLDLPETNALLKAAHHPAIADLQDKVRDTKDPEGEKLLSYWVTQKVASLPSKAPLPNRIYSIFVGRQEELQTISTWLKSPDVRVITLVGISGIGKSSLAIEAGIRHADQFSSGVCYVSAREISNFNLEIAASVVLIQLTGTVPDIRQNPSVILQNHLRRYPTLVILDNLNSLKSDELRQFVDYIRNTLPENGLSKVIITTQSYIREFNGWHFARHLPLTKGLNINSGIDWVKHTSQAFNIPFTEEIVRQIITKLDGHPKLLEITISKARRWGWQRAYDEILQIEGDFEITFTQIIASSIKDLPEDSKTILQYSTVFATATFLADEMKVLIPPTHTQWGLEQLVDLCLASYESKSKIYRIHQLVSDYVDRFTKKDDLAFQEAHKQLAEYYIKQLEFNKDSLQGMLLENAIGLATWCSNNGLYDLNVRIILCLIYLLRKTGRYVQGIKLISNSIAALQCSETISTTILSPLYFYLGQFSYTIHDFSTAAHAFQDYLSLTNDQLSKERAEALHYLAIIHSHPRKNRYLDIDPIALYKASIRLWHKLGERLTLAYALNDLGRAMFYEGDASKAKIWIEKSLAIGEKQPKITKDDYRIWGIILRTTGSYYRDIEEHQTANTLYNKSIVELEQAGDPIELGGTLFSYGRTLIDTGNVEQGIQILLQDISLFERFGYSEHSALTWTALGKAYTLQKDFEKAVSAYKMSMSTAENLPQDEKEDIEYIGYYGLGRLESRRDNYSLAVEYLQKSLELRESIKHDEGIPDVLYEMAIALAKLGKKKEALNQIERCLILKNETKYLTKKSIFEQAQNLKRDIEQNN